MLIVLLLLLSITLFGLIITRTITEEKKLFTLLPVSMLVGTYLYIFTLNLNAKFVHGSLGILLSTLELILIGLYLFIRYKKNWIKLDSLKFSAKFLLISLTSLIIFLSVFKMVNLLPAADASMQWAYAATFAKGNYPIKAPWQPDLDPNYHLGAYFLEGAILSLSGLGLLSIHTLINIFFLISASLMALFIFWENKNRFKNIWLVYACLILFISFGVIIIIYPNIFQIKFPAGITGINQLTAAIPAKGGAGASLVDLDSLSFLPARSLSLGLALLSLYFISIPFKRNFIKILTLSSLIATTALVEESMFLPMVLTLGAVFVFSLFYFIPKLGYLKQQRKTLFLTVLITSILVILQGGFISENILSHKQPVYILTLPFSSAFTEKFNIFSVVNLNSSSPAINWLVPSPLLFILLLLIYSFFKKQSQLGVVGLFSVFSFLSYLTVEYKYCGACSIRLHSFGNIAAGYGFMILLFFLIKKLSWKRNLVGLLIIVPTILIPTLLPDVIAQSKKINEGLSQEARKVIFSKDALSPQKKIIDWANKNLPVNARIIVIDIGIPSPGGALRFQYGGLYTILGPQFIHVNRQEPGPEYFDLALTLNPSILEQTKTDYIYIESESPVYKQLPQFRKDNLANSNYFQLLQSFDTEDGTFYRLYQALPQYFDKNSGGKEIKEGALQTLNGLIPDSSTVYVTDYADAPGMSFWYRMALVLTLKNKGLRYNYSQTDYQVIETNIPHIRGSIIGDYDYYILGPEEKLSFPAKLIWSNIYAKGWKKE